jgi:isoleucyl-tRNA synthetase
MRLISILLLFLQQCHGKNIHLKRAAMFKKSMITTTMVIDPFLSFSTEESFSNQPHKSTADNLFSSISSSYIFMYSDSKDNNDDSSIDNRRIKRKESKMKYNNNTDRNYSDRNGFLKNILSFLLMTLIIFNPSSAFATPTQTLNSQIKTYSDTSQSSATSSISFPISLSSIPTPSPSSGGITMPPPQPQFNAPSGIRESIAKSAANIPGINN